MRVWQTAFVYEGGRVERWEAALRGEAPAEFFYGAVEWKRAGEEVRVFDWPKGEARRVWSSMGRLVAGWMPPKMRLEEVWSAGQLLRELREVDWVVGTTSGTAFALGFWKRMGRLRAELAGIHCGIVNCDHAPRPRRAAGWLGGVMEKFVFAESEIGEMRRQFGWEAVQPLWFGADADFWSVAQGKPRRGVLAVGNDARRDYATLIEVARRHPEWEFRLVTRRDLGEKVPTNVEVIRGDWKAGGVKDEQLREWYRGAACVVVPLLDSVQPSGQSVAMQAMLCGAPVVMTRTEGWWGAEVMRCGETIEAAAVGNVEELGKAIGLAVEGGMSGSGGRAREALVAAEWTSAGWAKRMRQAGVGVMR